jgi:hypothetical protein
MLAWRASIIGGSSNCANRAIPRDTARRELAEVRAFLARE